MRNVLKLTNIRNTLAGSSILYRTTAVASMALAFAATDAKANPTGGVAETPGVSYSNPDAKTLVVTTGTDRSIINWQNFDIMQGETTKFVQPGVGSVSLNRVVAGQNASQILGTLTSNGTIVLVNPNGVFFGQGSKVDVAGLVATSANISSKNFTAGNMNFNKAGSDTASVINKGTITVQDGGLAALVAPGVENDGTIRANAGTITLASGSTVAIDMYGDNLYSFAVGKSKAAGIDNDGNTMTNGVSNTGTLTANQGTIELTANVAKNIVNNVVNNTGIIEASGAHVSGGTVIIDGGTTGNVHVAGNISVAGHDAGSKGGNVTVSGKTIELASATIDATGAAAGGNVSIGGTPHGEGFHADKVTVDATSSIDVSADTQGNGGSVTIWSDKSTDFAGAITGTGYNGGSAEVSSVMELAYSGLVDLHANGGAAGTLLLDPANVVINNAYATAIEGTLNTNTNVDVEASNNLTVKSMIEWFGNALLKLGATNDIIVNNTIRATGNGGAIELAAGNNVTLNDATLRTRNGDISITGNDIALNNSVVRSRRGDINIAGTGIFSDDTTGNVYTNANVGGHVNINQNEGGSVQTAIDAIGSYGNGAQVTLGSGTYNEQVKIDGKNNFTLTSGDVLNQATITAPDVLDTTFTTASGAEIKSVVGVTNANNVTISNLHIDGLSKNDTNNRETGIAFGNASGTISGNTISNMQGNPANGVQGGYGIYLYADGEAQQTVDAGNNTISTFQKNGIVANGASLTAAVHHNTITGYGPIDFTAQNGIVYQAGAKGTIEGNTIGGIGYTPDTNEAADILLFQAGDGIEVSYNVIEGAGYAAGINAYQTNGTNIHNNQVTNSQDGIIVEDSDHTTIKDNLISSASNIGIWLIDLNADSENHNLISGNVVHDTNSTGIMVDNSDYTDVKGNFVGYTDRVGTAGSAGNINGDGIQLSKSNYSTVSSNYITQTASSNTDIGSGIYVLNSHDDTIGGATAEDGNHVTNVAWDDIKAGASQNLTISNNDLHSAARVGIFLGGVDTATVSFNTISDTLLNDVGGIDVDTGSNMTINDNNIQNIGYGNGVDLHTGSGIRLHRVQGTNVVDNNAIEDVGQHGIEASDTTNLTLSNNRINWVDYGNGITLNNILNANVYNNTITNVARYGINATNLYLNPGADASATSSITYNHVNHIGENGEDGIYVNGAENAYIYMNDVHNLPGHGINAMNLTTTAASTQFVILEGEEGLFEDIMTIPAGRSVISDNLVYNVGKDGIHVDTANNTTINHNYIYAAKNDGIYATNLTVGDGDSDVIFLKKLFFGPSGTDEITDISNNEIFQVGNDGIEVYNVANANITGNHIYDAKHDAIEGSNFYTVDGLNQGQTVLDKNFIFNIGHDGIEVSDIANANITNNTIFNITHTGITASDLYRSGDDNEGFAGQSIISGNEVYNLGVDGINLDTVENAYIYNNKAYNLGNDGIHTNNLYVNGTKQIVTGVDEGDAEVAVVTYVPMQSEVLFNETYNLGHDGIHLELTQNAYVHDNTSHSLGHDGIYATNFVMGGGELPPIEFPSDAKFLISDIVTPTGTGSYDNALFDHNTVYFTGNDGIHLDEMATATISNNTIFGTSYAGIEVDNSYMVTSTANNVADSPNGILYVNSYSPVVTNNTLNNNGIGVSLTDESDNGLLSGDVFTGNTLGINLDNVYNTQITGETINIPAQTGEELTVGLRIANGSQGTTVENTAFNGGNIAVLINGEGSAMQFIGDTSTFTGNDYYFVLENNAMFGDTLIATDQTFDGTRARDFTDVQLIAAEGRITSGTPRTVDVEDDATLGDVFYVAFGINTSPTAAAFDTSVLDDFESNKRNQYRRGNFSYAGRALNVVVDPIEPGSFDTKNMQLSLLNKASPTAAADIANLFANLAPAAGGNGKHGNASSSPAELAALAPAAGGPLSGPAGPVGASCGNNFLGDGYTSGFSCSVQ